MRFKDETIKALLKLEFKVDALEKENAQLKKNLVNLDKKCVIIRSEHKEQIKTFTTQELVKQAQDLGRLNPLEELNKERYTFDDTAGDFDIDILDGSV